MAVLPMPSRARHGRRAVPDDSLSTSGAAGVTPGKECPGPAGAGAGPHDGQAPADLVGSAGRRFPPVR